MARDVYEITGTEITKCPFGIYVDQAGYEPGDRKRAVMHFPGGKFRLENEQGDTVYSGEVTFFGHDGTSGEDVYIADFSELKAEGTYRVVAAANVPQGGTGSTAPTANAPQGSADTPATEAKSASFRIAADVHRQVFDDTVFAFYYLRCGCGLDEKHAGVYRHAPCHTAKAKLWEDNSVELEVSGGWHDAGDYGRYVTPGATAVAHLLYAYKFFPDVFDRQRLNIPEAGNGMSNILSECRVELEWFLKMQREDGAVYHKATTAQHAPFVMPEDDTAQMYVLPVSSSATADLAAVCALASGFYREYDADFADRLQSAALKSAGWMEANPDFIAFRQPEGCNTGWYGEMDDMTNRFWAWAELYALTGEQKYHERMKAVLDEPYPPAVWEQNPFWKKYMASHPLREEQKKFPLASLGYSEVGGFGALAYLLCGREKDEALAERFRSAFLREGERLKAISDGCGYGCAMVEEDYHWGSSMTLMLQGMIFALCDVLTCDEECRESETDGAVRQMENGEAVRQMESDEAVRQMENDETARQTDWKQYAAAQLHTLLGVNALGYSYVTGCGEFAYNNPHLRPAFADGIEACMPGMVSGGPNRVPMDPPGKVLIPEGTPPMKCFVDHAGCYSLNEITIYWNSPTVFVLAYLLRCAE